jgi:hypothetical protein
VILGAAPAPSRLAALVALALAASTALVPASADDHRPPQTVLRSPGDRQIGRPWTYVWGTRSGEVCAIAIADGVPNFDRAGMRWRPHQKVHLRLFKRHKPNKLRIRMYRRLDDHGYVTGKSRGAAYNLRRVTLDGRRIWIAGFFARPRRARHLYLDVHVGYRDVEGCGGMQSMSLAFHLRRMNKASP